MVSNQLPRQRPGVLSRLLLTTLPIAKKLKQWNLERTINLLCLTLVGFYQRQISPHKGFRCAHRALHQGASCSAFFAINLKQVGMSDAIPRQIERFQQCKQANRILKRRRQQYLYPTLSQNLFNQNPQQNRKRKKRQSKNTCDWIYCADCDPFLCDCDPFPDDCGLPQFDCGDLPCEADCCDCD